MQAANNNDDEAMSTRMAHAIGLILSGLIRDRVDYGVWFEASDEGNVLAYDGEDPVREWKVIVAPNGHIHMQICEPKGKLDWEMPQKPEPPDTGQPQP